MRKTLFVLGCFGSIALLLGHLYQIGRFHFLGLTLGAAALLVMVAMWVWGRRARDGEFLLCLKAGLVGGIWGTIGYDVVRIPLHLAGLNPFPPIRVYGMWLAGADYSTAMTDLLGFAYHLSNGITFAWIYALIMLRRHWLWAVAWGLLLEVFAIVTVFGEVFNIRYAPVAMALAFGAHLFYGYPLGLACQKPEEILSKTVPIYRKAGGWLTAGLLVFCFVWFLTAWQPIGRQPELEPGEMRVGPDALYPGCSDVVVGSELTLRNAMDEEIRIRLRRPHALGTDGEELVIPAGGEIRIKVESPGVHQVGFPERGWRSIIAMAHRDGDYRPQRPSPSESQALNLRWNPPGGMAEPTRITLLLEGIGRGP